MKTTIETPGSNIFFFFSVDINIVYIDTIYYTWDWTTSFFLYCVTWNGSCFSRVFCCNILPSSFQREIKKKIFAQETCGQSVSRVTAGLWFTRTPLCRSNLLLSKRNRQDFSHRFLFFKIWLYRDLCNLFRVPAKKSHDFEYVACYMQKFT